MTRKRAKRPSTAVRKGRLAVYCIASELQTEKLQRYLLQRKKERAPGGLYGSINGIFFQNQDSKIGGYGSTGGGYVAPDLVGLEWRDKNYMGVSDACMGRGGRGRTRTQLT